MGNLAPAPCGSRILSTASVNAGRSAGVKSPRTTEECYQQASRDERSPSLKRSCCPRLFTSPITKSTASFEVPSSPSVPTPLTGSALWGNLTAMMSTSVRFSFHGSGNAR